MKEKETDLKRMRETINIITPFTNPRKVAQRQFENDAVLTEPLKRKISEVFKIEP